MSLVIENLKVLRGDFTLEVPKLSVAPGNIVCVMGASGSGKSTLLNAVAGFYDVSAGDIRFNGKSLIGVAPERRRFALVFQRPALFGFLNVGENVAFALRLQGVSSRERGLRAESWLQRVGLDGFSARRVETLSEGQAQRVALARALAAGFPLLGLDEPFSALDRDTRAALRALVRQLVTEEKTAALLVTHESGDAEALGDSLVVLENGKIIGAQKPL